MNKLKKKKFAFSFLFAKLKPFTKQKGLQTKSYKKNSCRKKNRLPKQCNNMTVRKAGTDQWRTLKIFKRDTRKTASKSQCK